MGEAEMDHRVPRSDRVVEQAHEVDELVGLITRHVEWAPEGGEQVSAADLGAYPIHQLEDVSMPTPGRASVLAVQMPEVPPVHERHVELPGLHRRGDAGDVRAVGPDVLVVGARLCVERTGDRIQDVVAPPTRVPEA